MRIDLKQLAKIEKQYRINDNHVTMNTVQTMIDVILSNTISPPDPFPLNYIIASQTLKELGILVDNNFKKVQQLNS